jgi:hypothetical protein
MQLLVYVSVVAASAVPHDPIPLHPAFSCQRGIAPPQCGRRQGGHSHGRARGTIGVQSTSQSVKGTASFSIDAASNANSGCTLDGDDDGRNSGIQHQGGKYATHSSPALIPTPHPDRGSAASTSNHCPTLVAHPLIYNRGQRRKLGVYRVVAAEFARASRLGSRDA